jgi:hypothetical protein
MLRSLLKFLGRSGIRKSLAAAIPPAGETLQAGDSLSPEIEVYGAEHVAESRLFERWASLESWLLRDQAIPLLLGVDPEHPDLLHEDVELKRRADELWRHAERCVRDRLGLRALDSAQQPAKWRVAPADLYRWAVVSRIAMPETLERLLAFVAQVVKEPEAPQLAATPEAGRLAAQVAVLGAALAIISRDQHACRDNRGVLSAAQLAARIEESAEHLFGTDEPPLPASEIIALLRQYLRVRGEEFPEA